MKFNKRLQKIVNQYKKHIPHEYWFNYKSFKKILNDITKIKPIHTMQDNEDCCVCLENNNLMNTFCCQNKIHHVCLFRVLASDIASCPMCRADIYTVLKFKNETDYYNARIISLISMIQLSINRIETIIRQGTMKEKYIRKFSEYNRIAVIKMCKKIDKNLHINCKPFFAELMNKHGILKENDKHHSILERICMFFNA